jgi:perosamine synthetase
MITRPRIPVAEPVIGEREVTYVTAAVKSGWVSSKGPYVAEFEQALAQRVDAQYAVAVSSGTAALTLSMAALGIGPGDEVIVPTFSFAATANTVCHVGATPNFADSDPTHWCMDPGDIQRRITPRTKAIMPVHLYGHPAEMSAIIEIAQERNLKVIENAAEALGSRYNGRPVGCLGDVGIFSFFGNKLITTGEGGMVVTNDLGLAERLRMLRDHGMDPRRPYWHPEVGYNFRLTNLQAALGLAQLEQIDEFLVRKREIDYRYRKGLGDLPGIVFQQVAPGVESSYWLFALLIGPESGITRDHLQDALLDRGIDSRRAAYEIHTMPPHYRAQYYPVAARLSDEGLHLPSAVSLTDVDQEYVVACIRKIVRGEG